MTRSNGVGGGNAGLRGSAVPAAKSTGRPNSFLAGWIGGSDERATGTAKTDRGTAASGVPGLKILGDWQMKQDETKI